VQWTVVIAIKGLAEAKSRLLGASTDPASHWRLVRAIRQDTMDAARSAAGVARILVVTDRPAVPGADPESADVTIVQSAPGLNVAVGEAAGYANARWPADGVAALVGDLPALRPDELAAALAEAGDHPSAYVPDADGTGTTLLTARPGRILRPRFGPGSAEAHARSAFALRAGQGLRLDVDTAADLRAAAALGLGPAVRALGRDDTTTTHPA
jgi:2-phospho-L-lactate guanylyltransferase